MAIEYTLFFSSENVISQKLGIIATETATVICFEKPQNGPVDVGMTIPSSQRPAPHLPSGLANVNGNRLSAGRTPHLNKDVHETGHAGYSD